MNLDFLIIGQGLAGSLLAWELIQRNRKILVIDNGVVNASQVAAGLINPITGMRLVKSQDTEQQLITATQLYQQLATEFSYPFYSEKSMLRIIRNHKELHYCHKRMHDAEYQPYLYDQLIQNQYQNIINAPLGILKQKQTGYLQTRPLLARLKSFLIQQGCYKQCRFDSHDLLIKPDVMHWHNIRTNQLIFCDGYQSMNNPWFSWLPMQAVKGEILTLFGRTDFPDKILNYGHWLIPVNQTTFRTGATFDRENINTQPTSTGKQTLLGSLASIYPGIDCSRITEHQANIRPCTQDKQPFIGCHPQHSEIMIFNGFGAKGSLQIPWYSKRFAGYLLNKTPLPPGCNIDRYYATHFSA